MACCTRLRFSGETEGCLLSTRLTVPIETFAVRATSRTVAVDMIALKTRKVDRPRASESSGLLIDEPTPVCNECSLRSGINFIAMHQATATISPNPFVAKHRAMCAEPARMAEFHT